MRKLLKGQGTAPRVMVTDKLRSYSAAKAELMQGVEHRSHKGLNNRAENSHLAVRRRGRRMMRFKSARQCQHFVSTHGQIANLFLLHRKYLTAADHRQLHTHAISIWGCNKNCSKLYGSHERMKNLHLREMRSSDSICQFFLILFHSH